MIKGIIFDKDGTLLDTETLAVGSFCKAFEQVGASSDPTIIKSCIGLDNNKVEEILEANYGKYGLDNIKRIKQELVEKYYEEKGIPLKEGAMEIIKYAKKHFKIAVATSTPSNIAIRNLKKAGIYDYLDVFVSGDMVKRGKPFPDIFLLAASKMDLEPSSILVVEDSRHGVIAGRNGGFKVCLIPDLVVVTKEMEEASDFKLDSLFDLIKKLEEEDI